MALFILYQPSSFFFSSVISKGLSLPGDFLLMLLCRVIFFLFHAREKRKVGMIFILIFTFYLFFFLLDKRHSWRYHFWAYGAGNSSLSSSLFLSFYCLLFKKPVPHMMMITNFSCLALYERIMRGITILCLKGLDYLRRALAARGALLLFLFLFLFLVGGKTGALCR